MSGRPVIVAWIAASALACSTAPPPPAEVVPAEIRGVGDPVAELEARLARLEELVAGAGDQRPLEAGLEKQIEEVVREAAQIVSLEAFEAWPLLQAELRTKVLFVTAEDPEVRRAALQRCQELLADLTAAGGAPGP